LPKTQDRVLAISLGSEDMLAFVAKQISKTH